MTYNRGNVWDRQFGKKRKGKDVCGAKVCRWAKNGQSGEWDVDHIFPQEWLRKLNVPIEKRDAPINLRVMLHANRIAKGSDYPVYHDVAGMRWIVNAQLQAKLADLYNPEISAFLENCEYEQGSGGELAPETLQVWYFLKNAGLC